MEKTPSQQRLTVDVAALQRLPAASPAAEGGVGLGAPDQRSTGLTTMHTCCCSRITDF